MVDYHIHTDHSGDGRTPLCMQVQSAIEKGLSQICITSHYDADAPVANYRFDLDFPAYFADVTRCAEQYGDRIDVKLGLEAGLQADKPHVLTLTGERIRQYPFDFIIASTHFLPGHNYHSSQQWLDDGIGKAQVQQRYLQHTLQYLENFDDFDVLGHLTYFSRFSPDADTRKREMTYQDNKDLYDNLFEILIRCGKGIEVNTSTKDKLGFYMPDYSIVRRFRQMGGEIITFGSDAHIPQNIGAHYFDAVSMIKEAGFNAICTFDRRKPVFVDI